MWSVFISKVVLSTAQYFLSGLKTPSSSKKKKKRQKDELHWKKDDKTVAMCKQHNHFIEEFELHKAFISSPVREDNATLFSLSA